MCVRRGEGGVGKESRVCMARDCAWEWVEVRRKGGIFQGNEGAKKSEVEEKVMIKEGLPKLKKKK